MMPKFHELLLGLTGPAKQQSVMVLFLVLCLHCMLGHLLFQVNRAKQMVDPTPGHCQDL